jgi:formylglycine-generating enzyme required for sulfatase activity
LFVDGGTYDRTYPDQDADTPTVGDPATVSSFLLDKYEVTVGRFRQFVTAWDAGTSPFPLPAAGSGIHAHLNGGQGLAVAGATQGAPAYESGWSSAWNAAAVPTSASLHCGAPGPTWTDTPGANENLPMTCVTWPQAYAFCIWDDGFLPSEAEWEYAAAGGSQQRAYPWGSADPGTAGQYAVYSDYSGTVPAPVGSIPAGAGAWGQLDLAGNVWEFVLDGQGMPWADPCVDCVSPSSTGPWAARGGDFQTIGVTLLPPFRPNFTLFPAYYDVGIRCARSP